jgi:hypothetical protein
LAKLFHQIERTVLPKKNTPPKKIPRNKMRCLKRKGKNRQRTTRPEKNTGKAIMNRTAQISRLSRVRLKFFWQYGQG